MWQIKPLLIPSLSPLGSPVSTGFTNKAMVWPSRLVHSSDGTAYPPPALWLTRERVSGPGWLPARLVEAASASALLCEVVTGWCGRPLHSSQPLAMRWNKLRLLLFSGVFFPWCFTLQWIANHPCASLSWETSASESSTWKWRATCLPSFGEYYLVDAVYTTLRPPRQRCGCLSCCKVVVVLSPNISCANGQLDVSYTTANTFGLVISQY